MLSGSLKSPQRTMAPELAPGGLIVSSFDDFVAQIRGLTTSGPELAADTLHCINRYLYQHDGAVDGYSAFEEYWREHHGDVLGLEIDNKACAEVADILNALWTRGAFVDLAQHVDVSGVPPNRIANVRFFTAVQDFKVDIYKNGRNPYKDAESSLFDARRLLSTPSDRFRLLKYLGAEGSQTDKRLEWMEAQARFLTEQYHSDAFMIAHAHNGDATAIKQALTAATGIGFKEKKADMFLRDMAELGVWHYQAGLENINVASDANTMRVALRTGILKGRTPLISSFLDVYCYQYGLVDRLTQDAWRAVWIAWGDSHPTTQPKTPASMDYMLYKGIGKTFCSKTPKCARGCPFDQHCAPSMRRLQPPKSISIYGMTGWNSASSDEGGGLGLSS